jgi:hypothetical protein
VGRGVRVRSSSSAGLFEFVEAGQEGVNVLLLEIVRSAQAELAGFAATDANFVGLPEPVFEVHAFYGWDVNGDEGAAHARVG